tara:strand:+ start:205 stop:567 length:363 start_codon:yes stop_codon:yes gene_type:complete
MTTQNVPRNWIGTEPEWLLFTILQSMGKVPGQDFIYRGPNAEDGIAFQFFEPPDLAINVMGLMQNYARGTDVLSSSIMAKQQLMGLGIRLIFIDDVDLEQDPEYYVAEALQYRDHSHMGS